MHQLGFMHDSSGAMHSDPSARNRFCVGRLRHFVRLGELFFAPDSAAIDFAKRLPQCQARQSPVATRIGGASDAHFSK
jgi:hypothetical protein